MPTIAAFAYRHSIGMPYAYPDNDLSYTGNFLNMLFKMTELKYKPNPVLERALDVLFILHADHEQNCSTNAMRSVGSSQADPYSAIAAATAALYGPLHGGANEAVIRMLMEIGSIEKIPGYIKRVKAGEVRLMGFGHRIYKNYDPRAKIIKRGRRRGLRGDRAGARCSTSRSSSSASRSPTTTSSRTSSTRTSTSTRASSTRRWASRWTCSRCCSRSRGPPDGWRSGRRCCSTRSRRSRVRARSISAQRSATTYRWTERPE